MDNKEIAKVCHAVNTAYCLAIGDGSAVPWEEAPESQHKSAIDGVGYHLEGERSPEELHQAWMDYKINDGWKFGEVKDEEKKEHPCLVSYDARPQEQRIKDYLFAAVVDSLSAIPKQSTPAILPASKVPVKYVGIRGQYLDPFTKEILWIKGETRLIPVAIAHKMLRHADVFLPGDPGDIVEEIDKPELDEGTEKKQQVENMEEETRFQIKQMNRKDSIVEFCKIQWGLEVDKKGKSVSDLQEIAIMHMDNLGLIENDT